MAFLRVFMGIEALCCLKGAGAAATGLACKPCWGAISLASKGCHTEVAGWGPLIFLIIS